MQYANIKCQTVRELNKETAGGKFFQRSWQTVKSKRQTDNQSVNSSAPRCMQKQSDKR